MHDVCDADADACIQRAAQEDSRIRILYNPVKLGPGLSRNRGIEEVRGEYISFVDSDDRLAPDFLELLYRKAKKSQAKIVKGTVRNVYEDGRECPLQSNMHASWYYEDKLNREAPLYSLFMVSCQSDCYALQSAGGLSGIHLRVYESCGTGQNS